MKLLKIELLLLALLFSSFQAVAQSDFRDVKWGLSLNEVKNIETSPLTKEEKNLTGYKDGKEYYDGVNLIYEGVTIADKLGNLTYYFKNGKLNKVRIEFVPTVYIQYDESTKNTIAMFRLLYEKFTSRGFKMTEPLRCGEHVYSGPDRDNPDNRDLFYKMKWGFDEGVLTLIEKMVNERKYKAVFFKIENTRTRGSMMFLTEYSEWRKKTPVILELTPSFAVEKELEKSDF